jgi:Fur family ferric uptake transcriptional regulator
MSVVELQAALVSKGVVVHKTTMYRQLEVLVADGWLTVTRFADGVARYERQAKHHHHVVCRLCKRVEEISLNTHLQREEKRIAASRKFTNITHTLEFFGVCVACARQRTHSHTLS